VEFKRQSMKSFFAYRCSSVLIGGQSFLGSQCPAADLTTGPAGPHLAHGFQAASLENPRAACRSAATFSRCAFQSLMRIGSGNASMSGDEPVALAAVFGLGSPPATRFGPARRRPDVVANSLLAAAAFELTVRRPVGVQCLRCLRGWRLHRGTTPSYSNTPRCIARALPGGPAAAPLAMRVLRARSGLDVAGAPALGSASSRPTSATHVDTKRYFTSS